MRRTSSSSLVEASPPTNSFEEPRNGVNLPTPTRREFTRSRSPAPHVVNGHGAHHVPRASSPASRFLRKPGNGPLRFLLPARISFATPIPLSRLYISFSIDLKYAVETVLLLGALEFAAYKISTYISIIPLDYWLPVGTVTLEISLVALAAALYVICIHTSLVNGPPTAAPARPSSPRNPSDTREAKRGFVLQPRSVGRNRLGLVFMTVPKNYRSSADDGIVSGLVLAPLIASALLFNAATSPELPKRHIEAPLQLLNGGRPLAPLDALVRARCAAVNLGTLCAVALLAHVGASAYFEARHRKRHHVLDGERGSVPRSEMRKWWLYTALVFAVTGALVVIRTAFGQAHIGIWRHLSVWEVACAACFFQFSLYIAVRLAHKAVTLGELSIIVFGATALYMELINITAARIWPVSTAYIKTFRLPTPLLLYQIALVPGSLLTGFLLSPLLALSRHIAQQPLRRLKVPNEKEVQRRWLAFGFYFGSVLVIGGLIGMWTRWTLGGRDPWLWVLRALLEGPRAWTRPALLAYWAALGSLSVAGWNRQLARSRRLRPRLPGEPALGTPTMPQDGAAPSEPGSPGANGAASSSAGNSGVGGTTALALPSVALPNMSVALPAFPNSEWLDAADRRVPTLGLNGRRKFFHLLAVVMFVPGVASDPAFTHLAFGAAFALFTFAEYVRYFALWPLGAAVHVFISEFLDAKDSGAAVLSHFYLLTGCASSVWFEAPQPLLAYTGILTVGVGDAVASIVGKRIGRTRWSATTSKTVEGSVAFLGTVVACAVGLRLCGLVDAFSVGRYGLGVGLGCVLEAVSSQNDNVVLPVYVWSVLALSSACGSAVGG
ncbi:hypothetical protein K488DRAFT_49742 [Vararia minispora EC-137]|uniref:Uncharacterized protein n=1 Tax=Vararia minispora EC-137 TaxID=1314806 RepID=A0ACB8QMF7_9AGAM|nr:hypothetical protein K488DRAFT_49742 [Vararia minispora EC-137]